MSNSFAEPSLDHNEGYNINDHYQLDRGAHERSSNDRSNFDRNANLASMRRSISNSSQLDSPLQPPSLSKIPSSLSHWDGSPSSVGSVGTGDKPKQPFKTKSKHNLAIFGAKLSSTAASVGVHTSKYKQQRDLKEQHREPHRESVFVDSPELHAFDPTAIIGSPISMKSRGLGWGGGSVGENGNNNSLDLSGSVGSNTANVNGGGGNGASTGGGGGSLKSKMFKQSKTDLKSLKIKTDLGIHAARSSLNDRSPMARGGSNKELDRIAALGQLPHSPVHPGEFNFGHGSNSSHHHHHPHLNFLKRDSPAAVLSSSASNSTLASEGTVYSFNQANNHAPSVVSTSSHHSFKTPEEAAAFLSSSWTLLNMRIQPVFKKDEALRIPVEDVNILVFMHFTAHHEQGRTGLELLNKIDELLQRGLLSSSVTPTHPTIDSLSESWHYFFGKTLLSLEAIFLPLQLELDGMGQVFTNSRAASEYWFPLIGFRSSAFNKNNAIRRKSQKPNIRKRVLTAYRDLAVLPILPNIKKQLEDWAEAPVGNTEVVPKCEIISHLLQCFTVLSNLKTQGEAQVAIDDVLKLLSKNVANQKSIGLKRRL